MGDHADDCYDEMMDTDELQQSYANVDPRLLPDYVQDMLYDYDGSMLPFVFSRPRPSRSRPTGPGPCPACGSPTTLRTNRATQGLFFGCSQFPTCRGSRDWSPTS